MKKLYTIFATTFLIFALLGICACSSGKGYEEKYYANYGQWYSLPEAEDVIVKNSDGNVVKADRGRIFVTDPEGYTLTLVNCGNKQEAVLVVINDGKPYVRTDEEMMYGCVGKEVRIINASASDGVMPVEVTKKMYLGDDEIDISKGFIPETAGTYILKCSATAVNGKTTEKDIDYYIEETDNFSDKLASFDKPYGVNQLGYDYGVYSYSTDYAFEGEDGSLKIDINTLHNSVDEELMFFNLNQANITRYDCIYFYVYNGTHANLDIYLAWKSGTKIPKGKWTRVALTKSQYYDTIVDNTLHCQSDNISLENINGFNVEIKFDTKDYIMRNDAVYFSAFRGMNKTSADTLLEEINRINKSDEILQSEADNVVLEYSLLSTSDKGKLYEAYKAFNQKRADMAIKQAGVDKKEGKILYFDNDCGMTQVINGWGISQYGISEEKLYEDKPTMKIVSEGWDLSMQIVQPYIYDITGKDILEFAIYNSSKHEYILRNNDPKVCGLGNRERNYVLKAQQWNKIVIPVGSCTTLTDTHMWISPRDWLDEGIEKDTEFYISSLYVSDYSTCIKKVVDSGDYSDETYIDNLIDAYKQMSVETRDKAVYYDILLDKYIEIKYKPEGKDNVLGFDNEGIKYRIDIPASVKLEYTEDKAYDSEGGSTLFTLLKSGANFEFTITSQAMKDLLETKAITFNVYYEGERDNVGLYYRTDLWNNKHIKETFVKNLVKNEWTEITIDLNGADSVKNWIFLVMDPTWNMLKGEKLYFSNMKIVK